MDMGIYSRNLYLICILCYLHRYGEAAAQVTQDTLATAGHVVGTAWTVSKLRKAFNPKDGASSVSKTGMVKGLAKNVLKGK